MHVEVFEHGGPKYELAVALRDRVLRQPLGLQFTAEQLAAESNSIHIAGTAGGRMIACCVIAPKPDGWFQLRQFAVDFDFQRMGFGRQLTEFAHGQIIATGGLKVFCHSRDVAIPFYAKLGYQPIGDFFEEISIQHIRMEKQLSQPKN